MTDNGKSVEQPAFAKRNVDIGDKAGVVQVDRFRGTNYLGIHYFYNDHRDGGKQKYSSNGINIPLEDAPEAIELLAEMYLEATGEILCYMPHHLEPDNEG